MKNKKIALALSLFSLGFLGILSILTMELPLPEEAKAILSNLPPIVAKLIVLANPVILLTLFVTVGIVLYQKVHLKVPIMEKMIGMDANYVNISDIIKSGITGGIIAGSLLSLVGFIFIPNLPEEFIELGESLKPTLAARFLYGGITEEILMRFGLMTLIVWIAAKITGGTKPVVYWIGIIIAAILFALGHFPIAYQAVENPSMGLLAYILIGNTIGGLIFGWLYWKKGLESSFIAHIFAHVIMVIADSMMS